MVLQIACFHGHAATPERRPALPACHRLLAGLERGCQAGGPSRHIQHRSGSAAWHPRRPPFAACSASRQERQADRDPAAPDTAPQPSTPAASGECSVAAAAASGDFSDGSTTQSANDAAQLIGEDGVEVKELTKGWGALPARYQMVVATSAAFVICNMDKVNISVAIIPMAQDFGWSPTVSGLVQSSFFWGFALSQIPGGYLNSNIGGRKVLPTGVGLWSLATAGVPLVAGWIPGLYMSRALVGLGEGVAPSSATDMVARVIAKNERSRAISFIFSGLHVGSLLGLLVAPPLIENFGWETVFYIFGIAGLAWVLWFQTVMADIEQREPDVARALSEPAEGGPTGDSAQVTPWRGFLRNAPLRALAYTHFCNNWFHYTMLAWLPTYFTDTLSLNLSQAAQVSLAPPIAALAASAIAGPAADALIDRGVEVERVRKISQCVAFLGPSALLTTASFTDNNWLAVGLITGCLGLASFSLAGLYCNHADLSPRHAPLLLGMTNTAGAIPGIIGVVTTGAILDQTGSWPLALFVPSIFFFVTGAAAFTIYGSAEQQDFSNNEPFAFEDHPAVSWIRKLPFFTRKDKSE